MTIISNTMPVQDNALLTRLIMYLSGQSNYVPLQKILSDMPSGLTAEKGLDHALSKASPLLETKDIDGELCYRLSRTFDGYKRIFNAIWDSDEDIYGFLFSDYSGSMVNEAFIKEAVERIVSLPYFEQMATKYPDHHRPGEVILIMLSQSPGFPAMAAMFKASPSVASKLLSPETLSKYELSHLKVTLDLAFACDMVKRVPPGTEVSIRYEVISRGATSIAARGGTGIP